MMNLKTKLILIIVPLLSGCAALTGDWPRGWQCYGTFTVGDVVATSFRNINLDGTPGMASHGWEWRRPGPEANISVMQTGLSGAPDPWIVVNLGRPFHRRIFRVELSAGDGSTRLTDPHAVIRGRQEQYVLTFPLQALLALPRPVAVVAYDRQERVAFRIVIDVDAVARGPEALERADGLSLEATRDYRSACQRLTNDASVIT